MLCKLQICKCFKLNCKFSLSGVTVYPQNNNGISNYSRGVLNDDIGNSNYIITSTTRTPAKQVDVMYNNISKYGVNAQKELYGTYGDQVIDMYPNKPLMLSKVNSVGPSRVSKHCGNPRIINVIDISPNSIRNRPAFERRVRADSRVSRFYTPPADPAYHLEIPQPQ